MSQNLTFVSFAILTQSTEAPLADNEENGQAPVWRCGRLEALVYQFGFSTQEKDEIHRINSDLHKKMTHFIS